ncbi:MAG: S4 domain-containing protein YaaA [Lactobacillus sp.]
MSIIKYFTISGEYITLGQFLKEESFISSGGQAKFYLQDNPVTLNGELENRRGKKLHVGDRLLINGQEYEFRQED